MLFKLKIKTLAEETETQVADSNKYSDQLLKKLKIDQKSLLDAKVAKIDDNIATVKSSLTQLYEDDLKKLEQSLQKDFDAKIRKILDTANLKNDHLESLIENLKTNISKQNQKIKALEIDKKNLQNDLSGYKSKIGLLENTQNKVAPISVENEYANFADSSIAKIIPERCSKTSPLQTNTKSFLGVPLLKQSVSAETALSNSKGIAGACWAFEGKKGRLSFEISRFIYPTHISIEYLVGAKTAPKVFSLYSASNRSDVENRNGLGRFDIRETGDENQSLMKMVNFDIRKKLEEPASVFEVDFEDNFGSEEVTCVYQVKIHGVADRYMSIENSHGEFSNFFDFESDSVFDFLKTHLAKIMEYVAYTVAKKLPWVLIMAIRIRNYEIVIRLFF